MHSAFTNIFHRCNFAPEFKDGADDIVHVCHHHDDTINELLGCSWLFEAAHIVIV